MKKHRPRPRKPKPPRAKVEPAERREDGSLVFYHGGPGWLNVGDFILPRGLTGADGARADWPEAYVTAAGVEDVDDADWVHITTNSKLAARFAVLHKSGNGKVFRVSPEGKIEPDQTRAQAQDCWRCSRAQIVAIEVIPYQDAQKIRAERPKNFDEAADDFEQFVKDDAETLRRAQENALIAGQNLVEQKVGELATSDLSPRFIATELLAHAIHMLVPSCEILFARILAAKHWETVLSTLPVGDEGLALRLQAGLYKPADRLGARGDVRLLATPVVQQPRNLRSDAHANELARTFRPRFSYFHVIAS